MSICGRCAGETDFFKYPGGSLEAIEIFCYLDNLISSGRGCSESEISRVISRMDKLQRVFISVDNQRFLSLSEWKLVICMNKNSDGNARWALNAEDM